MTNRCRNGCAVSCLGVRPSRFAARLVEHKNGALLRLAEGAGFDAFLTADQSLRYQQNLSRSRLRIIVFEALSNRLEHIGPLLPQALAALLQMSPGELRIISAAS